MGKSIWLFNIAMENVPFIDGLPIKNGDFPWPFCWIPFGVAQPSVSAQAIAVPAARCQTAEWGSLADRAGAASERRDSELATGKMGF